MPSTVRLNWPASGSPDPASVTSAAPARGRCARPENADRSRADRAASPSHVQRIAERDLPLGLQAVGLAVDRQDVEDQRLALGPGQNRAPGDFLSQRLLRAAVREAEVGRREIDVRGHRPPTLGADPPRSVDGDARRVKALAVERIDDKVQRPLVADALVERHVQGRALQACRRPRERQQHWRAIPVRDPAGKVDAVRQAVRADRRLALELQRIGGQGQLIDPRPAFRQCRAIDHQGHVRAEEVAVLGQEDRRDVTTKLGREALAAALGFAQRHGAGKPRLAARRQGDLRLEVRQRPGARRRQLERRPARQVDQAGDDPVRTLRQVEVDGQLPALVVVGRLERQAPLLAVDALCRDVGGAGAAGKRQSAFQRHHRFRAEQRLAQFHPLGVQAANLDRDGQFRQREALRLGRGHVDGLGFLRLRQARQQNLARRQFLDLHAPAQEGGAVPVEHDVAQGQPHALVVGDGQLLQRRARGQRPFEAGHGDLAARAGQRVLDLPLEEPAAVLLLLVAAAEDPAEEATILLCCHGQRQQQDRKGQPVPQNACPIPT